MKYTVVEYIPTNSREVALANLSQLPGLIQVSPFNMSGDFCGVLLQYTNTDSFNTQLQNCLSDIEGIRILNAEYLG